MDSRAPRANRGVGLEGQGCYRPDAVSVGPKGHGSGHSLSISRERSRVWLRGVRHRERHVLLPDRPHDAAEFISDRDRGFVVAAPRAEGQRPVMQPCQRLAARGPTMSHEQDGPGAVRQEAAQVHVAAAC